ncbi:MAG TPA: hypothetical protein VIW92_01000 [Thermoanaerobaculia bacterium]
MTLQFYKVLHVLGMAFLFTALGGLLLAARAGVQSGVSRKTAGMTHGIALLLILVSGFGALAKYALSNPMTWPAWVWLKFLIWLALGGIVVAFRRAPQSSTLLWWILPLLGALAAYLALYKPAF